MADFKAFLTNGSTIDFKNINSSGSGSLSGEELQKCLESSNHNSVSVEVAYDGSVVLIDDRKIRIDPDIK